MTNVLHGAVEDLVERGAISKEHRKVVVEQIGVVLEGMVPINEDQTQVFIEGIGAAEVVLPRIRFNRLDYVAQKIHEAFLPWNCRNLFSNRWANLSQAARSVRREMARAAMQAMSQNPIEVIDIERNQEGEIKAVEIMDSSSGSRVRLCVCEERVVAVVSTTQFLGENI